MSLRYALLPLAIILSGFGKLTRADSLEGQLFQAAEKVAAVIQQNEQSQFMLGAFEPAGGDANLFGPGLRSEFAKNFAELVAEEKTAVELVDQASFELTAQYAVMDDPEDAVAPTKGLSQMLVVKIDLQLKKDGELIFPITLYVDRFRDIAKASGTSGLFRIEDNARDLHEELRRQRDHPRAIIDGSRIKSSVESKMSVEILTKSVLAADSQDCKPRSPTDQRGLPLVAVAPGEVYEVRIHNDEDYEVAVAMTIDGIDQFTFSEDRNSSTGRPKFSHWIVQPHSSFTIKGWHKTADENRDDNLLRFLVTKYGDGASQFVPPVDQNNVGAIGLAFSRSHANGRGARGDSETGFGPPVKQTQTTVRRQIDPPHEFLTIRYHR